MRPVTEKDRLNRAEKPTRFQDFFENILTEIRELYPEKILSIDLHLCPTVPFSARLNTDGIEKAVRELLIHQIKDYGTPRDLTLSAHFADRSVHIRIDENFSSTGSVISDSNTDSKQPCPIASIEGMQVLNETLASSGGEALFGTDQQNRAQLSLRIPLQNDLAYCDVLLLEDELSVAEVYLSYFRLLNIKCQIAQTIAEAKTLLEHNRFQAAIVDLRLPDGNGLDFIRESKKGNNFSIIVATSALRNNQTADESNQAGADTFLAKPFSLIDLRSCLESTFKLPPINFNPPLEFSLPPNQRLEFHLLRTRGEISLTEEDLKEFTKICHHFANEAFGYQIGEATTAFSQAEEAALNGDLESASKHWQTGWTHLARIC